MARFAFAQLGEKYTNYKRRQLAPSTIAEDFERVGVHVARFPVSTLDGAVAVRDYLNSTTTPNTTKRVLTQLNACCAWAVNSRVIEGYPVVIPYLAATKLLGLMR